MPTDSILIVDDNPTNLELATFLLQSRGYEVRTACDAEEAIACIEERVPRLILMDIQLPGIDGLTLTRRLRADPRTADVLIIAVTAYAMRGDDEKALEAGCDDYIPKPIDTRALPIRVADCIARGRARADEV